MSGALLPPDDQQADEAEAHAGQAGPDPPGVLRGGREDQEGDQGERPQTGADGDGGGVVGLGRLGVGVPLLRHSIQPSFQSHLDTVTSTFDKSSRSVTVRHVNDSRTAIDRFFSITERGSTISREVRGGLATFFTMAYIVVLNPIIIAHGKDIQGEVIGDGTEPKVALVAAGTAFVAGLLTILMGVVARVPFALAAGLGLNAFVTFNIAPLMTWEEAMGLIFLEGIVIGILVLTGLRVAVFRAIPSQLQTAISVGIGLFIALIGFVDAGFVRRVAAGAPLEMGIGGNLASWPIFVFVVGLLATAAMVARKVKGAILIGIVGTTLLG